MSSRERRLYTNDVSELRKMSAWWREWVASADCDTEVQERGELCLNEAVANIIGHGGAPCAIAITFDTNGEGVRMTIADDGAPFDPVTYPAPVLPRRLDEARPGGLGIYILRTYADVVQYSRVDGWNELTLTFS